MKVEQTLIRREIDWMKEEMNFDVPKKMEIQRVIEMRKD